VSCRQAGTAGQRPTTPPTLRVSVLYSLVHAASHWWRRRGEGREQEDRRENLLGLEDNEGGAGHLGDVVEHDNEEDAGADQLERRRLRHSRSRPGQRQACAARPLQATTAPSQHQQTHARTLHDTEVQKPDALEPSGRGKASSSS
jgi:hypothetical protein